MVAVRSSGLAFDCIVGYSEQTGHIAEEDEGGRSQVHPIVTEAYLRTLIGIANKRFEVNAERRERFRLTLLKPHR
jgi:tRNA wybutosine-synthesizing protein 3